MFPSTFKFVNVIEKDDIGWKNRNQASNLVVYCNLYMLPSFELHIMLTTITIIRTF
jgi:hypothetical protein